MKRKDIRKIMVGEVDISIIIHEIDIENFRFDKQSPSSSTIDICRLDSIVLGTM